MKAISQTCIRMTSACNRLCAFQALGPSHTQILYGICTILGTILGHIQSCHLKYIYWLMDVNGPVGVIHLHSIGWLSVPVSAVEKAAVDFQLSQAKAGTVESCRFSLASSAFRTFHETT